METAFTIIGLLAAALGAALWRRAAGAWEPESARIRSAARAASRRRGA